MAVLTQIWFEPHDVDSALRRLRLTRNIPLDAIAAGYLARSSCTGNDAPFFPALAQWAGTLRALRERLIPEGWSKCNDGNYCVVVDPDGRYAIAVATGCSNTGLAESGTIPTTKSPKGPNTLNAVYWNAELIGDLFPETLPRPVVAESEPHVTWLLLFHTAEDELRAELSLPASMGYDGYIDAWKERIMLPATPLDPLAAVDVPEFGPELDVEVKRRA